MPHKNLAQTYQQAQKKGGSPRETEGRALLEAARRMAEAQQAPDNLAGLRSVARLNWRLWTIFQAEVAAPDCPLPAEVRTNMLNLCNFVDKRMVDFLAEPDSRKLDALIHINRQIAAGLLADPEPQAPEQPETGALKARPQGGGSFSV